MTALRSAAVFGIGLALAVEASCAGEGELLSGASPDHDASVPPGDGGDASRDASAPRSCAEVDWCPVATNVDHPYTLTALWGSGDKDVWAVGAGGTAIHWAGTEWVGVPTNTKNTLLAVWGSSANDVWAVSTTSTIVHGTGTAGLSVVPASQGAPTRLNAIRGRSATDVRVGGELGEDGNFWSIALDDGVVGMTHQPTLQTGFTIFGIWFDAGGIWLVGDARTDQRMAGVVLHAADVDRPEFARIDSQSPGELHGIWGSEGGDVWVVGAGGAIRHFAPGSTNFTVAPSPVTTDLRAVWGAAPDDIWAVGDGGTVIHFDGTAWTLSSVTFGDRAATDLRAVWGSGPNDVWAVGGNVALHFTGTKSRRDGRNE